MYGSLDGQTFKNYGKNWIKRETYILWSLRVFWDHLYVFSVHHMTCKRLAGIHAINVVGPFTGTMISPMP